MKNSFGDLASINIIQSSQCAERKQFRFPKSKKKRIRAKWSKREENYKYIPKIYRVGNTIYCHPYYYEKLKKYE